MSLMHAMETVGDQTIDSFLRSDGADLSLGKITDEKASIQTRLSYSLLAWRM